MITDSLKRSLKKRSKLTKCYYKNRQKKSDYEKLEILEDKNNYIFKITTKLQDPKTAEKTYWDILCRLLYKKKIPAIAPWFVYGKLASNLCEKSNLLNNFFGSICTSVKNLSALSLFSYRAMPEQHRYFTEEDI